MTATTTRTLTRASLGLLLLCLGCGPDEGQSDRRDGAIDWVVGEPAEAGLDATALEQLALEITDGGFPNTHALLIERDGRLVFERYFSGSDERWGGAIPERAMGPDSIHDLRSISKSVTSALLGIALEGDFASALSRPIAEHLPGLEIEPEQARITLHQTLTMTSGLEWNEMSVPYTDATNDEIHLYSVSDPAEYVMTRPIAFEPGSTWYYSGGSTQVIAAVITQLTGQSLDDFARDRLFEPLGITDFEWLGPGNWTPDNPAAMSGLRLTARDLAKIGSVYLHGGRWREQQVIPADWVERSMNRHVPEIGPWSFGGIWGYGYQWWVGELASGDRVVAGVGNGDQRLFIFPEDGLVVTIFAGAYNNSGGHSNRVLERVLSARLNSSVRSTR